MTSRRVVYVAAGIAIALGALALGIFVHDASGESSAATKIIYVDGERFNVVVADTLASRARGLGGTESMIADGMLFIFDADGKHAIWMKDMNFSIDIVWITADGLIVHTAQSISQDTFPQVFTPDSPARYVLEVPAGFVESHDIRVGSRVTF